MTTENTTPNPDQQQPTVPPVADNLTPPPNPELNLDKAPPKEGDKPEPKDGKPEPYVYQSSGDAGLDMLLEAAGNLGLNPEHPAMKAAVSGDFTLLGVELEKADVKGANRLIQLGEKAYADLKTKTTARQAADLKAVQAEVGGEEQWNTIRAWASANADEGEKKAISAALGKGGLDALMAAAWLASAHARATGNTPTEGAGPRVSETGKGAPATNGALSPREYAKAVAEARVGFKGDFETSAVYKGLQARRMAWRP